MDGFSRRLRLLVSCACAALLCGGAGALLGACGPFTDVAADAFCPFVLEIFYLGITTGTTATTYDPTGNVTRLQMAAFLSRTVDGVLKRGSRRAALGQFWTQKKHLQGIGFGSNIGLPASDGQDVWVPLAGGDVIQIHASDLNLVQIWSGAASGAAAIDVLSQVFITGATTPGSLYRIAKNFPSSVSVIASNLGGGPGGLAYDGSAVWTANASGSISMVTLPSGPASTVTTGFGSPIGALYDGSNVWVTDNFKGALLKLNSSGAILQTVTVGTNPLYPVFDGANIWVPNGEDNTVSVVRASNGAVLATLTGNGLAIAFNAAFDGQRLLVTNLVGDSVSLWKASDLTPLGSANLGLNSAPKFSCSDGVRFWIAGADNFLQPF